MIEVQSLQALAHGWVAITGTVQEGGSARQGACRARRPTAFLPDFEAMARLIEMCLFKLTCALDGLKARIILHGHGSDLLVGDDSAARLFGDLDWEAVSHQVGAGVLSGRVGIEVPDVVVGRRVEAFEEEGLGGLVVLAASKGLDVSLASFAPVELPGDPDVVGRTEGS